MTLSNSPELKNSNLNALISSSISTNDENISVEGISSFVDNITNDLNKKIDNAASDDFLDKLVESKSESVLNSISDLSKEGVQKIANIIEAVVDKIIEEVFDKSPDKALTDAYKASLLKEVDENFDEVVAMLQDNIESIEQKGNEFVKTSYPMFEEKLSSFLKSSVSKINEFAKKEIAEIKDDFEEFGAKIKALVTKHNDFNEISDLELADNSFVSKPVVEDFSFNMELSGELLNMSFEA
ncbi:MAG: hypothetical protein ACK4OM_03260 [Alphaproteobacteria bacterium]